MVFSVIFAYNSTNSIPAVGAQRKTYTVKLADDNQSEEQSISHEMIDLSEKRDIIGRRLFLQFKIGAQILYLQSERDWFTAFFTAKHKWAVYGNFKDTANSANSNLYKCNITEKRVNVTVDKDSEEGFRWELISEKTF